MVDSALRRYTASRRQGGKLSVTSFLLVASAPRVVLSGVVRHGPTLRALVSRLKLRLVRWQEGLFQSLVRDPWRGGSFLPSDGGVQLLPRCIGEREDGLRLLRVHVGAEL